MQEKTRIEWRMKLRQEARFAVMKVEEEEEARSDCKYEHPLSFRVVLDYRLTVEKIESFA